MSAPQKDLLHKVGLPSFFLHSTSLISVKSLTTILLIYFSMYCESLPSMSVLKSRAPLGLSPVTGIKRVSTLFRHMPFSVTSSSVSKAKKLTPNLTNLVQTGNRLFSGFLVFTNL